MEPIAQLVKGATWGEFLSMTQMLPHSHSPVHDLRLLACHVSRFSFSDIALKGNVVITEQQLTDLRTLLSSCQHGKPVSQAIGYAGFWVFDFLKVTPDVLTPRPDTEVLVETCLGLISSQPESEVLELGTGTGAIAMSLAYECPRIAMTAVDVSNKALAVARDNLKRYKLLDRVDLVLGNWFDELSDTSRYDLICSNPPYLEEQDPHLDDLQIRHEPMLALVSGLDGLDAVRIIARGAKDYLNVGGWLVLEHGCQQGRAVQEIMRNLGYQSVQTNKDLNNLDRVTFGML